MAKPLALKRCLANVIENAIFYAQCVRIELRRHPDHIHVIVSDDGPGIPAEQRERVFEPFVRLEPSRNRHTGGSGLGLAIARHIVRAHGGDIRLETAREGGLSVTLSLPLQH